MLKRRLLAAALAVVTAFGLAGTAHAAGCGGKLGTARNVSVSPSAGAVHGYERSLGLRDGEVVLTFDDGPLSNTSKVLRALADECVRATFFVVGRHVQRTPGKVRSMRTRGHTIAHHTWNHERLPRLGNAAMERAVDRGIRAVNKALYGTASSRARVPFFRYPYLAKSKRTRALLRRKGLVEVGANIDTGDWRRQSPAQLHDRIMAQLRKKRRGIVLMHDIQPRTAAMLPRLLRSMKAAGFKVVHLVPGGAAEPKAVAVAALEPEAAPKRSQAVVKARAKSRRRGERRTAALSRAKARKSRASKPRRARRATPPERSAKRQTSKRRIVKRRATKRRSTKRARRIARRALGARFIIQ